MEFNNSEVLLFCFFRLIYVSADVIAIKIAEGTEKDTYLLKFVHERIMFGRSPSVVGIANLQLYIK